MLKHEFAARRSEELYQKMIDEVQDYAIIFLDENGIIQDWNMGAEKIKGYKAEEIIGKSFKIFYTQADKDAKLPDSLIEKAKLEGRAAHEGWRERKDGSHFWGSTVITALHDDNHKVIGYSKLTRDLTERKKTEDLLRNYAKQLEQKNEELEHFAYIASHDIQEPLRKIISFGDLLANNYSENLDERAQNYISRMQNASERMMNLIESLLEFSAINESRPKFEKVDLNQIFKDVISDLELAISNKNANITISELPQIMGRPFQLQQLFQNLISNSLKFNTNASPQISVIAETIDEKGSLPACRIQISDNGIGFNEEDKRKIFDAFFQLHPKSEYAGAGLGLAICKKIVELHNGSITADSQEGEGATFTVTLPLEQKNK